MGDESEEHDEHEREIKDTNAHHTQIGLLSLARTTNPIESQRERPKVESLARDWQALDRITRRERVVTK